MNKKSLKKRKGSIEISLDTIEDLNTMKIVFSKFIPVDTMINYFEKTITYYGYSEEFEEVEEGFYINEYIVIVSTKEGIVNNVMFERLR